MATNAPNIMPALLTEPIMPKKLSIKVGNLERGMVAECLFDMRLSSLHKEAMVVGILVTSIKVEECHDIDLLKIPVVEDIRWYEVEMTGIPC
jgi:hypothetical protein